MNAPLRYKRIPRKELVLIQPHWEALNRLHLEDTVYFKKHYASFSFEKRAHVWLQLKEEELQILVAESEDSIVGYCVSRLSKGGKGEIDSLFVAEEHRKKGIGEALLKMSIAWLQENNCYPIQLTVSYGHESVIGFYKKLEFFPRATVLEFKKD